MNLVEYVPPAPSRDAHAVFEAGDGGRWTLALVGHRPGRPSAGQVRIESWRILPAPAGKPGRPRAAAHLREQGPGVAVPCSGDPAAVAAFWFRVLRACREHDGVAEALVETLL